MQRVQILPVRDRELSQPLLALVELPLPHSLVHRPQLGEVLVGRVPDVLDLLVHEEVAADAAADNVLLEDLLELVLKKGGHFHALLNLDLSY